MDLVGIGFARIVWLKENCGLVVEAELLEFFPSIICFFLLGVKLA